jgi:hypothetical protein
MSEPKLKFDMLNKPKTYCKGNKTLHRDVNSKIDSDVGYSTSLKPGSQIQTLTPGDAIGGSMRLTFELVDGTSFTLFGLSPFLDVTTLQASIDAQMALRVADYTAGDVEATGGPFGDSGDDTLIEFKTGETIVGLEHPLIVVYDVTLQGSTFPAVSVSTPATNGRFWFAALRDMGVITGTDPAFGAAPNGQYATNNPNLENFPNEQTIRCLLMEASMQEGQDWSAEILPLLGWKP